MSRTLDPPPLRFVQHRTRCKGLRFNFYMFIAAMVEMLNILEYARIKSLDHLWTVILFDISLHICTAH